MTKAPTSRHRIRVAGGGPTNLISADYFKALSHLLDVCTKRAWQRWWADSPHELLEIWYWFDASKPMPRVRAGKQGVTASINRPAQTQLQGWEGVEQAREDVTALFEKLRLRFHLSALPPLPNADVLAALAPVALEDDDPRNDEEMLGLMENVLTPAQMKDLLEALNQSEWIPRGYAPTSRENEPRNGHVDSGSNIKAP